VFSRNPLPTATPPNAGAALKIAIGLLSAGCDVLRTRSRMLLFRTWTIDPLEDAVQVALDSHMVPEVVPADVSSATRLGRVVANSRVSFWTAESEGRPTSFQVEDSGTTRVENPRQNNAVDCRLTQAALHNCN